MDRLFHSTYSPRNTSGLNEGNSAWHLCESEENQILLLTDGQRVDLSPRDVNQCSLTAPPIRNTSLRFPGTVQDCIGRFCQEMKKDGDLHVPSPANPLHTNEALIATAGCFPLNFLQLWTCQTLTLRTCMILLHLTVLELSPFVQSCRLKGKILCAEV